MNTPGLSQAQWRKSTYSGGNEGECVEIANLNGRIAIRDSKSPHTCHVTLTRQDFTALLGRLASQP
ncbi:DUF397 domain-containing protein [Actinomadura decatromicini]|uniref:DUF397 domain-containing protein n=1 Tax=Actinomadura decatromicini TaxID=2604572 RepID=A0A5D3FDV5_9ACTN|nr:DUF397 domain-containing protein [Actinomadura decatromicini]TYK46222.1 DUF397 domain-containing protein [Actinomadura decatromicini]